MRKNKKSKNLVRDVLTNELINNGKLAVCLCNVEEWLKKQGKVVIQSEGGNIVITFVWIFIVLFSILPFVSAQSDFMTLDFTQNYVVVFFVSFMVSCIFLMFTRLRYLSMVFFMLGGFILLFSGFNVLISFAIISLSIVFVFAGGIPR